MSTGPVIARVFPRRTSATPTDELAFVGGPPLFPVECDEVHVSVTFTWDLPDAEILAREWSHIAPATIGGPATGGPSRAFTPGRYLAPGYVITSRGCPNRCPFCLVPPREGALRELPITDGWIVLDDNLLACSDEHVRAVFAMLARQKAQGRRVIFSGGLEAALLKPWHVECLRALRPKRLYFAYDTPGDLEPLREAGRMLLAAGFTTRSHSLCAYVLVGYKRDTFDRARTRLQETVSAGFMPFAMAYWPQDGTPDPAWRQFAREWNRPAIIARRHTEPHPAFDLQGGAGYPAGRV